jgi:hypothetical protein
MSDVLQNIDPPPPSPPGECVPPAFGAGVLGEDTLAGWRGGWGVNILEDARHRIGLLEGGGRSIFWKTPDTALYSTYVSTLWVGRVGRGCIWHWAAFSRRLYAHRK